MKLEEYLTNKELLEVTLEEYIHKQIIKKTLFGKQLSQAHMDKALHNLHYVDHTRKEKQFNDWQVVGLYYAVYHGALALLAKQGYSSKNHQATLLFIIKHNIELSNKEVALIDSLRLQKEDAEFYTELKDERQKASYATGTQFDDEKVSELRKKSIQLINKIRLMLEKNS